VYVLAGRMMIAFWGPEVGPKDDAPKPSVRTVLTPESALCSGGTIDRAPSWSELPAVIYGRWNARGTVYALECLWI